MADRTITVSPADVSLFHIASRVWGDATAWFALADANNMTDPFLYGPPVTLIIPDYDPAFSGGAPQQ